MVLDDCTWEAALWATSKANLFHQRVKHLGPKSVGILVEVIDTGVSYNKCVLRCGVCAAGKNKQLGHPKKSVYDD